jgi:hypothetical protein
MYEQLLLKFLEWLIVEGAIERENRPAPFDAVSFKFEVFTVVNLK